MTGETLTPEQAADVLQLNPETIRRMIRRGELQAVQIGRRWRIPRAAIDRLLQGGRQEG